MFREFDHAESPQLVGYMTMLTRRWEQVSNRADDADADPVSHLVPPRSIDWASSLGRRSIGGPRRDVTGIRLLR